MESQIIFTLIALVSFFLFMITALRRGKTLIRTKSDSATLNIPPGPRKLPIIGNIHNLITSTPHRKLRDLANIYGPLMHLQLGEVFAIVVSTPEYAKEVMKTHDLIFASRPTIQASQILAYNSTNIVFAPYGNYWRQLRKICTLELFTPKRVNSFKPVREEELGNLIERIENNSNSGEKTGYSAAPINLTEEVLSSIYTITSRAAFGMRFKEQEKFISCVKEAATVASGFEVGDVFPSHKWLHLLSGSRMKLERLKTQLDDVLQNIIKVHKQAKGSGDQSVEDLVDVLLRFEDTNASLQEICLTRDNIKAIILDIFSAGSETAATTIAWAMAELVKNPTIMNKAQIELRDAFDKEGRVNENCINELKYLKSVVKETLRLHPPAPLLLPRECGQAIEIKGYHIPYESKIIVNAWAMARDPNYWSNADRFCPERFVDSPIDYKGSNFEYIPFGAGRRICPGSTLGLINVELTLAFLLYHFDWRLPNGVKCEDLDMTELFGITVRRKDDLYLIPIISRPLPITGK